MFYLSKVVLRISYNLFWIKYYKKHVCSNTLTLTYDCYLQKSYKDPKLKDMHCLTDPIYRRILGKNNKKDKHTNHMKDKRKAYTHAKTQKH